MVNKKVKKSSFFILLFLLISFSVIFILYASQNQTGQVTIRPQIYNGVLSNPGMGFTTFRRFDSDVQDYPKSTIAYFRWYWDEIMPAVDTYDWTVVDETITEARSHGQRLACGVMPVNGWGHRGCPQWYIDLGANGFDYIGATGEQNWMPDHNDPLYLEHYGKLIEEFGKRYDGHPDIDHVDMRSLGHWGEWHFTYVHPTPVVYPEVRRALVDIFINNFKKTPILMPIEGEDELAYSIAKGTGWRADCLGDLGFFGSNWNHMEDFYQQALDEAYANNAWKRAPVAFESCGVMQDWYERGWDVEFIFSEALRWHCSIFNNKSSPVPAAWQEATNNFLKLMGYRFIVRSAKVPEYAHIGDILSIETEWENVGVAPIYRRYLLAFKFQNIASNEPVMPELLINDVDIRTWLPGIHSCTFDFKTPLQIPPGNYTLAVALLDSITKTPAVKLAIKGGETDGWYNLCEYEIENESMRIIIANSELSQNYPNPFNSSTIIDYRLHISSNVVLTIYNTKGQCIRSLIRESKSPGYYIAEWDGRNDGGIKVPSGIYFYKIKTDQGYEKVKKMVYTK